MLRRAWAGLSALLPVVVVCCSSSTPPVSGGMASSDASPSDRPRLDGAMRLDAPCLVTVETPPLLDSPHVSDGVPVQYSSNPPSSGPHYNVWAAFQEYDKPIDRRYLVHSMEHGAVVVFYKCAGPGTCPEVAAAREAAAALPNDPMCAGEASRVRVIIVPDPQIDVPLAAAAWGWVYKAACVDAPTLKQFVREHYAQAPENFCTAGQAVF